MKKSTRRFNPPKAAALRRPCPHCGAFGRIYTSEALTVLYRVTKFQCTDLECSFSWAEGSEVLYSLSPSGRPNPNINIQPRAKEQQS